MTLFRYGVGQLKIMFVGGPNQRKDYHIEEGEEVSCMSLCSFLVLFTPFYTLSNARYMHVWQSDHPVSHCMTKLMMVDRVI